MAIDPQRLAEIMQRMQLSQPAGPAPDGAQMGGAPMPPPDMAPMGGPMGMPQRPMMPPGGMPPR